jgi:hypothetical protein
MLGFVALALPESHPFWQSEEEAFPFNSIPEVVPLKHPKHIMVRKAGHTFLLSSGQECHYPMRAAESKYGKFGYSSAFGYSVPTGGYFVEAIGGDNMLAVSDDLGETWKVRRKALDARLENMECGPVLISKWFPWKDVTVETYLLPPTDETPSWHLRVHHVTSKRRLTTREAAFGLHGVSSEDERELHPMDGAMSEGRQADCGEAVAVSRGGAVGIAEIYKPSSRQGNVVDEDANSNLTESRSVLPGLTMDIHEDSDIWVVTAVFAIPSTVEGYKEKWHIAWKSRPLIPEWLRQKMEEKSDSETTKPRL